MYALKRGIIFFAWPVYAGIELIKYLFRRADYDFALDKILIGFFIWTILGFLSFGFVLWQMQEKRYQQLQKKESE